MDPEPDMLTAAAQHAVAGKVGNVTWVRGGSADLQASWDDSVW
ncbi:hypothetical protein Pmi06nite_68340 [Planotetraspora mira]|uniref:Uncharacterized protein n=1 Tax=Planotetraspora mira TaxID=58121 RepID=A0A8J3TW92_9ACTN|nr:hypothetical protein Pmi06nite_68340 [Planotetraspora mira]